MKQQPLNKEFLRMQKIAGLITESEFKQKIQETQIENVDQALDDSKIQAAGKKLANNPTLLQKAIKELEKLGIDKETLEKAAQAHASGKEIGAIVNDKVETASKKLSEVQSPENMMKSAEKSGATIGGILGAIMGYGIPALIAPGALPIVLTSAAVLALIGALSGKNIAKKDENTRPEYQAAVLVKKMGKEKALNYAQEEYDKSYKSGQINDEKWWESIMNYIKLS